MIAGAANRKYEVAFDPLDGSSNLDTNLPTGSTLKRVEMTAALGSGSAPRPALPQPRPRAGRPT